MSEETKQCLIISVCLMIVMISVPIGCNYYHRGQQAVEIEAIKVEIEAIKQGMHQRYDPVTRSVIWVRGDQ